jgi:capsular polysaccharide export protein
MNSKRMLSDDQTNQSLLPVWAQYHKILKTHFTPPLGTHHSPTCDVLILHRTRKKQKYFDQLVHQGLQQYHCLNLHYHFLPPSPLKTPELTGQDLQLCLNKAEQELFNAHENVIAKLLKPFLMWGRKIQMRKIYLNLYALLYQTRPKLILIWNGHKFQDNVLRLVNQHFKIPIGYFENGVLPNSTTLDFVGINALNSVPRNPDFFSRFLSTPTPEWFIVGRQYKTQTAVQFTAPARYILVPFQKERDSQILENSQWIRSMPSLVAAVTHALDLCNDKDIHVVFRPHPNDNHKHTALINTIKAHPRMHWDSSMPLDKALRHAEAVITINSSVGMEAILLSKKVILLGDAFYDIPGLSLKANNPTEFVHVLNHLQHFDVQEPLRSQFITYLQQDYVVKGSWNKLNSEHIKSVQQKIEPYLTPNTAAPYSLENS